MNIFCLESLWDKSLEEKLTVLPLLELTKNILSLEYIHLTCNTLSEFAYNIKLAPRKKSYRVLYLPFHGYSGTICFHDNSELNLDELAELMKGRFDGWTIHFSSCGTMKMDESDIKEFVKMTGASMVCGYTRTVEWVESSALDLLLFRWLQHYKNLKSLVNHIEKTYPDLVELNGFVAVTKN